MNRLQIVGSLTALLLIACAETPTPDDSIGLQGKWITEPNGSVMIDPQPSALKAWRSKLLTISDGSANPAQKKQLHIIDPASAELDGQSMPIQLSAQVGQGCFAGYLTDSPDYEGLAVDPDNDNHFVLVTEDATRTEPLSEACKKRYADTGSTEYPTLLVKLELLDDNSLLLTQARPVQYAAGDRIGDFPNDGVEGLAFGSDRTLYFGLERGEDKRARIFSVKVDETFWLNDDFVQVVDEELDIPFVSDTNHPINGMDYLAVDGHKGFLVAAARNDDQLWVIDLEKTRPTKVIDLHFMAPTQTTDGSCPEFERMNNASLEGVAVIGSRVWLINDPWRQNYLKNVQCEATRVSYQKMAPLLFDLPIDLHWTQ